MSWYVCEPKDVEAVAQPGINAAPARSDDASIESKHGDWERSGQGVQSKQIPLQILVGTTVESHE